MVVPIMEMDVWNAQKNLVNGDKNNNSHEVHDSNHHHHQHVLVETFAGSFFGMATTATTTTISTNTTTSDDVMMMMESEGPKQRRHNEGIPILNPSPPLTNGPVIPRLSRMTTMSNNHTNNYYSGLMVEDSSNNNNNNKSRAMILLGLTMAGVASTLLTTIFSIFHGPIFLNGYQIPVSVYSTGNLIFSVINTVNDLVAAWVVDRVSFTGIEKRTDMIGISGLMFALCFLTPFWRWKNTTTSSSLPYQQQQQDIFHFVISMSLYDTLYSFTTILMASIVIDDSVMTDRQRAQFMASGKITNLVVSFVVAKLALALFDAHNLMPFRIFLIPLTLLASTLFMVAQGFLGHPNYFWVWSSRPLVLPKLHHHHQFRPYNYSSSSGRKLDWKKVAQEFWKHGNFKIFVGMEILLESQVTFSSFFLKSFVEDLICPTIFSCHGFLTLLRPLIPIASLMAYIPMYYYGYQRIYSILFTLNLVLAIFMILFVGSENASFIMFFLTIYTVFTGAVQASGFHLAMSDLVLEMKRLQLQEGRGLEPSLAGLFIGINALLCKPAQSVLPILATTILEHNNNDSSVRQQILYHLLIWIPLLFSMIQLLLWQQFTLTRSRVAWMRSELHWLQQQQQQYQSLQQITP